MHVTPTVGPLPVKPPTTRARWQTRSIKRAWNKEKKCCKEVQAETLDSYILPAKKLQRLFLLHIMIDHRILRHMCTHLGNEKSSVKTWIRIWWAHRERWNASPCSVPAQCKQPAHVCACLPPLKLLSISLWCPFLLIQTFVPPATTDAIPPQDFIHKHSIRIPCLQPAPLTVQLSSPSSCKESSLSFR